MTALIFMSLLTIRTICSRLPNTICLAMASILFLDDCAVKFHYIKGNTNTLADALSHLPFDERQKAYASPSHDYHKHNIQAVTGSCQRVLNDDSVHV
jgi:hypothetical protein